MALVVNDRVKETSTTTGTVTFNLDGAVTGFETFSSAIGNGNTTYYAIEIPNTTEFEVGLGTIAAGTLARTTVISSSNSDSLVNFSAGTKNVFCTLPASKAVIEDASNNVTLPADLTVDTNTLHVDSSNNRVGINTTSPTQALTIDGGNLAKIQFLGGGFQSIYYGDSGSATAAFVHYDHSSDNYQVDVSGTITLDAPTSIKLSDNGTQFGQLEDSSNDFVISSVVSDKDLIFKGNDGGSTITALTFDMSEAGAATFNDKIILGANKSIEFGDSGETITGDGTAITVASSEDITLDAASEINLDAGSDSIRIKDDGTEYGRIHRVSGGGLIIKSQESNKDIQFQGVDGGSSVTALTLDMSEAGAATFNDKVILGANKSIEFGDAGETISGDGTDLTIASSNKIILNADGAGQVFFKDGGTNLAKLFVSSQVFTLETIVSDGDFAIKGNDNGSSVTALTLDMSEAGAATFNDKIILGANKAIEFGDAGESISGDGTDMTITGNIVKIDAANRIILDAAENRIDLHDNGSEFARFVNNGGQLRILTGSSAATAVSFDSSGAATFNDKIILGANKSIEFGDSGETITGDGTAITVASSEDITLDAASEINLDAGSDSIRIKDDGTEYGRIHRVSGGGLIIKSQESNKDIQFQGVDGGSSVTALTLDMSEAGAATFNDKVILGANKSIEFGDAGETISGDGTNLTIASSGFFLLDVTGNILLDSANNGFIALRDNGTSYINFSENSGNAILNTPINDGDFFIKGNDGGSEITALTLDMSEAGAATFNSDVTVGSKLKLPTNTANKILVADGTSFEEVDISGDATIASGGTLTLANSGVSAASYTNSSITVDAKGRVTAASSGAAGVSAGFVTAMAIAL